MRRRDALPDPEVTHGLFELDAALRGDAAADPDLALLVADVRDTRPEPDAAFLTALDERVRAGFPAPPKRPSAVPWHMRLRQPRVLVPSFGATLAAGLVVLVVASSGGGGSGGDLASSGSASSASTSAQAPESETLKSAPSAPSAGDSAASATPTPRPAMSTSSAAARSTPSSPSPLPGIPKLSQSRKVERAAELTLTPAPEDVQDTADGVVRATQAAGGYVQQSDVRTSDGGGTASLTLRIPSAKLDDTLADLAKLAHVGALSQSADDITAVTASTASLLSDARAERQALLRALGKATTARQIASLKARLADNRSVIARREGDLNAVRRRADLATVQVTVEGTGAAAKKDDGGAWTPRDALHDAGRVLEVAGGVALIALAVLAPLAVLALLALLGGRVVRRRRREGALDGAA
jgi:hypothetical protein